MKANEFIVEYVVKTFDIGSKIGIQVDNHFLDQSKKRNVPIKQSGLVVAKMIKLENELQQLELGQQFWIHDTTLDTSIGMRKRYDKNGKMQFALMTVVGNKPWDGANPILQVS